MALHAKVITRAPPHVPHTAAVAYVEGTDVEVCAAVLEALHHARVGLENGGCVEVTIQQKRVPVAGVPGRS